VGAVPGGAQFTGVVAPPRSALRAAQAAAAAESAAVRADSIRRTTLTDMRAWVDSAAKAVSGSGMSTAATGPAAADTTDTTAAPAAPGQPPVRSESTGAVADTTVPPDTATPFPLLAVLGLGALGAGLRLVRTRRGPGRD
jgi:hypothetical protein